MRIGSFEFNLRELSGSMGDFGTLLPLAVGYVTVCGMDPSGLLVFMGLANIMTGLVYRLPMPIEPMKALAIMAIAQAWTPDKILASGLAMGITWLLFGLTGAMTWIAANTPRAVTRGIQLALGVQLALQGAKMASDSWVLAVGALLVVLLLRKNRHAPAALVLVLSGIGIMAFQGKLAALAGFSLTLPGIHQVDLRLLWPAMRDGGLSQIPLTATNAVIATVALIREYWPDRTVTERQLALNMGIMNLVGPFMGGMPLCHGAGGLAGQYFFGARTGGDEPDRGCHRDFPGAFPGEIHRRPVRCLSRCDHRRDDVRRRHRAHEIHPAGQDDGRMARYRGHPGRFRHGQHGARFCRRHPVLLPFGPGGGKEGSVKNGIKPGSMKGRGLDGGGFRSPPFFS